MKTCYFTVSVLLLLCNTLHAQQQFGQPFFAETFENETVSEMHCADFNHDGQTDFLVSNLHWPFDNLRLYLQTAPEQFSPVDIDAADSLSNLSSFATGDMNADGWTDFVACYGFPFQITWYENRQDHFEAHLVNDSLDFTTQVLLCDFDLNGLPDILALQHTAIVVYMAQAPGLFDTGTVIHSGTEFYAIESGDFNGDSLPDIAVASGGFETFLGDGTGHFAWQDEAGIHLMFGLKAGDLDGDGDKDIAAYDALNGIQLYQNDGQGHFDFTRPIIASTDQFLHYELEDLNCDGALDVLAPLSQFHWVVVAMNEGEGHFTLPIVVHEQDPELIMAVTTGHLDSNGQPDILWGNKTIGGRMNECVLTAVDNPGILSPGFEILPSLIVAGETIRVKVNEPVQQGQLYILDVSGKVLMTQNVSGDSFELTCPSIPGAYIVWLKEKHRFYSTRFIVQ